MKKLIFLILALALFSFPQSSKNILELEEEIKTAQDDYKFIFVSDTLTEKPAKKKTGLAILYSLLLPGMGELYAESYTSGKYFTIAEGALWGVFIGMNTYGNWQKDRYKSFAISKAGITSDGKDEEYFGTISQYVNIEEYNNEKALERNFAAMYNQQKFYWNWGNQDNRDRYRSMWLSSEQTFNDVRFVVGAMIINRIASAINAVRLVAAYNKRIEQEISWNFSVGIFNPVNLPHSLTLNFQKSF